MAVSTSDFFDHATIERILEAAKVKLPARRASLLSRKVGVGSDPKEELREELRSAVARLLSLAEGYRWPSPSRLETDLLDLKSKIATALAAVRNMPDPVRREIERVFAQMGSGGIDEQGQPILTSAEYHRAAFEATERDLDVFEAIVGAAAERLNGKRKVAAHGKSFHLDRFVGDMERIYRDVLYETPGLSKNDNTIGGPFPRFMAAVASAIPADVLEMAGIGPGPISASALGARYDNMRKSRS